MSDDQLDDGFRDRVKEVFENYGDDSADEGWLLLREKYPARERPNRAIFWWRFAGVAACLALLLFFYPAGRNKAVRRLKYTPAGAAQQTATRQPMVNHTKPAGIAHIPNKVQRHAPSQISLNPAKTNLQAYVPNTPPSSALQRVPGKLVISHAKRSDIARISENVQKRQRYASQASPSKTNLQASVTNAPASVINTDNQPLLSKNSNTMAYQSPAAISNSKTTDTSHKKPEATVSGPMLALFEKDAQNNNNKIVQKQARNNVAFGVYTASYVNYAKGSRAQFNNGGGLSVDIRVSDRLSINTGVLVAQNSLAYGGSTSGYPAPAAAYYSLNFPSLNNLSPSSSNQAVSLVNLDVPVNLTYQFNPQKGNTYLSAGLSSGTFVNESYVTTYNYNISQNNTQQFSQDDHHKSFDDFYFGQMLNLAFGVGYPLGRNKLVIEPFFKYPLGGLGDQHILFGSGGLNLKFNFGPSGIQK